MSLPKNLECDCEVVDDPDMVCPKHQERLLEAIAIAVEALMKIHYATVDPKTTTQHCMDSAEEAIRRIEALSK